MARAPRLRWTETEDSVLRANFQRIGAAACLPLLPGRPLLGVKMRAYTLGLRDPARPAAALRKPLGGGDLARALAMHDAGVSYAAIAREFEVCESSATNAILAGRCRAAGFTPAKRDATGALMPHEIVRMRGLMMQGLKSVEIQLQMAVSAACVCNHRRRYKAELVQARQGKTLPPPGGGIAYSGKLLTPDQKRAIEDHFRAGLGTQKISALTGASKTSVGRVRNRLIERLARQGRTLPGCDRDGVRRVQVDSARFVPDADIAALRRRLLDGEPVSRAAAASAIGASTAYRIRDQLAAELAARGEALQAPLRDGGAVESRKASARAHWCPKGKIYRFRILCRDLGDPERAKHALLAEIATAAQAAERRPRSFQDMLADIAAGGRLKANIPLRRPDPDMTLGGVATGCL